MGSGADLCGNLLGAAGTCEPEKDEKWKITLDLFACETAQSLLEIAFLLRNDLRPELLCRIWKESSRRVLQPFLIQENGAFWWETSKSNWNAVCCGSVGAAACYASECGKHREYQSKL